MSAAILREIASVKRFVHGRVENRGSCDTALLDSFTTNIISMINATATFGTAEGSSVQDALKESPYGDVNTAKIYSAIDRRMGTSAEKCASHARGTTKKAKGDPQCLKYFWHFLTKSDWDKLNDDKKSFSSKMTVVVERMNSLGVTNCEEQTYKWALACLLLADYEELPSDKDSFAKLHDFKQCFHAESKCFAIEHIVEFLEYPQDLPTSVYNHAYSDEQPAVVELSGVRMVAGHIPLRSNSKLLKGPKARPPAIAECSVPTTPTKVEPPPISVKTELRDTLAGEAPSDPAERALWLEYQAKRNELQAQKFRDASSSPPASSEEPRPQDVITISRNSDGKLSLRPRRAECAHANTKAEGIKSEDVRRRLVRKQAPHAGVPTTAAPAPQVAPLLTDLDPYTRQALEALGKRNAAAKAEKAAEKAAAKAERAPEKASAITAMKTTRRRKVACKMKAAPAKPEVKKEKHVAAIRCNIGEVSTAKVMQARPKLPAGAESNPPPIYYNGGAIYTSVKVKRFRALGERGNNYSETSAGWGPQSHGSEAKAWTVAVESINKWQKNLKRKRGRT